MLLLGTVVSFVDEFYGETSNTILILSHLPNDANRVAPGGTEKAFVTLIETLASTTRDQAQSSITAWTNDVSERNLDCRKV